MGDAADAPRFPVTFVSPLDGGPGHTGNVWAWIFWWKRNGVRWAAAAPSPKERRRRERTRHSANDEIDAEALIAAGWR